jgi:hypothetical protein
VNVPDEVWRFCNRRFSKLYLRWVIGCRIEGVEHQHAHIDMHIDMQIDMQTLACKLCRVL